MFHHRSRRSLAAGVLALALLVPVSTVAEEPADFSRSDWIEHNWRRGIEFSGSLVPRGDWRPAEVEEGLETRASLTARRTKRLRRVNRDLLELEDHPQPGTQAEPYLHVDPADPRHLIAGWQENRFEDGGAQALHVAVSFDAGRSWSESTLPGLTLVSGGPWQRASDPWVEFGPDGEVYFASLLFNATSPENAIGVSRSIDGGRTWEEPVEVFASVFDFNDKEALTVDTQEQSPHRGRVYVAWDINVADAAGQSVTSQDLVISWSDDLGASWSAPRRIRSGDILPSFAIDPVTGDLYIAWQDSRWSGVDQATLTSSRDGGRTWSPPVLVSGAAPDAPTFTTSVAVNRIGQVAVSYYSLENDPARSFLVDHYLRISEDRGRSYGPPVRANRRTFDIRFAARARGYFLGDYVGLAAAGRQFHLLWIDTSRTSPLLERHQPDVWTSRSR